MVKRCIMIFPKFKNEYLIDEIRKKYDPLAEHVRPHITLVFPFESSIETSILEAHIANRLKEIKPFEITLRGITASVLTGNYLFLNINKGKDEIIEIHKRLYKEILEEFYPQWLKKMEFLPHMTVGNVNDLDKFKASIEETKNIVDVFETTVEEVSVEIIDEKEDSIIEIKVPLRR